LIVVRMCLRPPSAARIKLMAESELKSVLVLWLAIALLLCGGPRALAQNLLVENVNGYTFHRGELKSFDGLLIDENGRVLSTGSAAQLAKVGDVRRHDAGGLTMLPGLIDGHGHILGLGHARLRADLTGATSLAEALRKFARYAQDNPDLRWLQGRGWNQELWPGREFPSASDLDQLELDRPVWLLRIDGHAGWANSKAMELAAVDTESVSPPGGRILKSADGIPTGIFVDAAMDLIAQAIGEPSQAEDARALALALDELVSVGLTGVHDAGVSARTVDLYKAFADRDALPLRIYAMLSGAGANLDAFEQPLIAYGSDRLTVRSVKLYADGALGSRGAALLEPYTDEPDHSGLLFAGLEGLVEQIRKAHEKDFQVNTHAIGDRANRVVLDALAKVQGGKPSRLRHRIEHAQVVSPEDIPRFAALGVIPSMQPTHATSDMNMAEDRVGAERIEGAYAWRSFLDQGNRVVAGSDFPVESSNPFRGIHAAVTRQDTQGQPEGGWYPKQVLDVEEALKAFTIDAAYAAHQEHRLGSLEPGKWADFVLVDRDIFQVAKHELWQTKVLETWLAGERVYPVPK